MALTACRDQEAKVLTRWFIFSCALQPGAIQKVLKFLTLPVKQMHHPMKGHNGTDRRNIIYFLSRKITRRYS